MGERTGLTTGDSLVGEGIPKDDIRVEVGLKQATPHEDAGYLASPFISTERDKPVD